MSTAETAVAATPWRPTLRTARTIDSQLRRTDMTSAPSTCGASQRRHLRVDDRVDHEGTGGGDGAVPRRPDVVGRLDADPLEAAHAGEPGVVEVGDVLGRLELRVALHGAHLPCDLVEVVVVEDEHDEAGVAPPPPVLGDGEQLAHPVHLHCAVAG